MSGEPTREVTTHESHHRKLGYANEFKGMLREHPGIIKTATELASQAETAYHPSPIVIGKTELQWNPDAEWEHWGYGDWVKWDEPRRRSFGPSVLFKPDEPIVDPKTGLEITVLGRKKGKYGFSGSQTEDTTYFRMSLGDHAFFVKKSSATKIHGFREFQDSVQLKDAVRNMENLHVVEAQLGYTDDKQSWFVSKWEDLVDTGFFPYVSWRGGIEDSYGKRPQEFDPEKGRRQDIDVDIVKKINQVKEDLVEHAKNAGIQLVDIDENFFYNPNTDQFVLIDVSTTNSEGLNQRYY